MGKIFEILARLLPSSSAVAGIGGVIALLGFVHEYGEQTVCFDYRQLAVVGLVFWAAIEVRQSNKQRRYYGDQ